MVTAERQIASQRRKSKMHRSLYQYCIDNAQERERERDVNLLAKYDI